MLFILDKSTQVPFNQWFEIASTDGSAILINKKPDWTSFDIIAKLRSILRTSDLKIKKIGHCGTLDPFAEGLLIVCCGKATKRIDEFQNLPKQYLATIKLGATTPTLDIESEEENIIDTSHLQEKNIIETVNSFVGKIEQIPPMFSAKKVGGKKLYELARKNIEIERAACSVEIYKIAIQDISSQFVTCLIDCSKGTYIRALARDIGAKLGVGGYLTSLTRTAIGEYHVENAITIEEFSQFMNQYS